MKTALKTAYLDWVNNYTSLEKFAEDYGVTYQEAAKLVVIGKRLHDGGVETFHEAAFSGEVETPVPLAWHVVAVSSNHGAFGHKGVVVLRESGEGLELSLQAYGGTPLPSMGDTLATLPASEVPPRKLADLTPKQAAKIIKESKQ